MINIGNNTHLLNKGGIIGNGSLFQFSNLSFSLPPTSQRCTVIRDHNRIRLKGYAPDRQIPRPSTEEKEDRKMEWMINNTYNQQHTHQLAQYLLEGHNLTAVSDGSFHPEYKIGTSAWVIKHPADNRAIYGDNLVPGSDDIQCSHRSELTGLIGVVRHMNLICRQYNIQQGNIELGCDGLEAFNVASRYTYDLTTRIKHFDLVSTLHQLIKQSPLTWQFRHVKGHQDDDLSIEDIDAWGKMNITADLYAKNRLQHAILHNESLPHHEPILHSIPAINFNHFNNNRYANTNIYSHVAKTTKHLIAQASSISYWASKGKNIQQRHVNTATFLHAARNVPLWQRRWITKWSSGICGVGKWLHRWKDQTHSKCPRCQTDNETVEHVIHCKHVDATLIWATGVAELREWMESNDGAPDLVEIITWRLNQWRNQSGFTPIIDLDQASRMALLEQDHIGWDNFCFGMVGNLLVDMQKEYLSRRENHTPPHSWMSRLIRKVWDLQRKMWIHRNRFVHATDSSMHQFEQQAMDRAIRWEFTVGLNELPAALNGLFRGTVDRIINKDATSKSQWLNSVWSARDYYRRQQNLGPWDRDIVAATFLLRDRMRRKRRRRDG